MNAYDLTREERAARLVELRGREAARKVRLVSGPLMDQPLPRRIAFAICDPGAITPRSDDYREPLRVWQSRAVSYVVQAGDLAEPEQIRAELGRTRRELEAYRLERNPWPPEPGTWLAVLHDLQGDLVRMEAERDAAQARAAELEAALAAGPRATDGAVAHAIRTAGSAREEIEARLGASPSCIDPTCENCTAGAALADRYRAEVLDEAADAVHSAFYGEPYLSYPPDFVDMLRRMAAGGEGR